MRVLGPIVSPSPAPVAELDPKNMDRRAVGSQIVGDPSLRNKSTLLEELAHQFQRGVLVSLGLDQHIKNLALRANDPLRVAASRYGDATKPRFCHLITSATAPVAFGRSGCRWNLYPPESIAFSRRTHQAVTPGQRKFAARSAVYSSIVLAIRLGLQDSMTEPQASRQFAFENALAELRAGRIERAEVLCERILDSAPQDPAAHQLAATIALRSGRLDEAARWAKSSLTLRPDHAPTLIVAARVARAQGDLRQAGIWSERASQLGSRSAGACLSDVCHAHRVGRWESAVSS